MVCSLQCSVSSRKPGSLTNQFFVWCVSSRNVWLLLFFLCKLYLEHMASQQLHPKQIFTFITLLIRVTDH